VCAIIVKLDPTLSRSFPADENSIPSLSRTSQVCFFLHLSISCDILRIVWVELLFGWLNATSKIVLFLHVHRCQHVTMKIVCHSLLFAPALLFKSRQEFSILPVKFTGGLVPTEKFPAAFNYLRWNNPQEQHPKLKNKYFCGGFSGRFKPPQKRGRKKI
jgi:hypothetical protein